MSSTTKAVLVAIGAGLLFWTLDGVSEALFDRTGGLWEPIITGARPHTVYARCAALLMFVGLGFVIARAMGGRGRAEAALGETEAKYRRIVDTAHEGICLMDAGGNATYVNERLASMLGYRPEDLLGRCLFDLMEQVPDGERDRFLATTSQGMRAEHDFRFRHADGSTLWVLMTASRMKDKDGRLLGALALVTDITMRRQVEADLRESEERYRSLFERVPVGLYRVQSAGPISECNGALVEMLHFPDQETLLATDPRGLFVSDEARQQWEECFNRDGVARDIEMQLRRHDGTLIWVNHTTRLVKADDGKPLYYEGSLQDITARKLAEEALRRERDFAETLVETAQAIVLVLDTEGRIVRFNPYLEELSGYTLGEVQGRDWFSTFLPERYHSQIRELFRKAVGDIQTRGNINPLVTRDGRERLIEWYDKTLRDQEGHVVGLLAVGQDITDRKRAEEALDRSERMYRGAIETAGAVVYYRNYDTNVFEFVSPGIEALTGCLPEEFTPEAWDSLIEEIVPRGDSEGLTLTEAREAMDSQEGRVWRADYLITARDGTQRWVANSAVHISGHQGVSLASLGIFQDITERKRLEEKLRERSKMEAIGTLAGGIAHDFNNLLQGIVGYGHLVRKRVDDEVASRDLEQVRQLADRGAKLVGQLLAFGRKQMLQPTVLDLNSLVPCPRRFDPASGNMLFDIKACLLTHWRL